MSQPTPPSSPPDFPASQTTLKKSNIGEKGRFRFSKVFTRWWWMGALLVIAMTYTVTQIPVWMDMRGPLYESTALLEVKPVVNVTMSAGSPTTTTLDRQFINTQFEIIIAPATLELALAKSDLLNRLGGDKIVAMARMKKSTRTSQRRGTDLIEISYRDEDALLARDAVTAVYEAYKERRYDLEMSMRKDQLKAIKVELENKNERVAELRKRLMDMAEKEGVILVDDKNGGTAKGNTAGLNELAEKELYEAKGQMRQIRFQLNKVLSGGDNDFISVVAELPDVGFKEAYQKYENAISEIQTMKASGLAERHPDIKMRRAKVLGLKKNLEKRAINVRESLKHRLALMEARVKKLKGVVNDLQDQGAKRSSSIKALNVARKEYEAARNIKDGIEARYDLEKTKMVMPANNIIVHQVPEQGWAPVTRGRDFIITLGTVLSLPISIGLGILLMYIAEAVFPRKA